MSIQECYVCVPNINININKNQSLSDLTTNGCLDGNFVDDNYVYSINNDDLNYVLLNSNISDTYEEFSFILPIFSDSDTNVFYVDCFVEL